MSSRQLLRNMKNVFPKLNHENRKGENGRIAVIGGSFQFTGAPFYSAISALRVGGDLSHIFCSKFSSPAIKSYSPEIIVHPLFVSDEQIKYEQKEMNMMINEWGIKLKSWEKAIHSWVIGPGLGRDKYMQEFFPHLVKNLPNDCLAVFDADAIYYLCLHPHLFQQLKRIKAILTPNHRELTYLQKHFSIDIEGIMNKYDTKQEIIQLPNTYANPYFKLIIKDQYDIILGKDKSFIIKTEGGKKRCGGMGDILGGVMSVCALWDYEYGPALATRIVKLATRAAYQKNGRGLTAPCVISQLTSTIKNIESETI